MKRPVSLDQIKKMFDSENVSNPVPRSQPRSQPRAAEEDYYIRPGGGGQEPAILNFLGISLESHWNDFYQN